MEETTIERIPGVREAWLRNFQNRLPIISLKFGVLDEIHEFCYSLLRDHGKAFVGASHDPNVSYSVTIEEDGSLVITRQPDEE